MTNNNKIKMPMITGSSGAFSQCSQRLEAILRHYQKNDDDSLKLFDESGLFRKYTNILKRTFLYFGKSVSEKVFASPTSEKQDLLGHPLAEHTQKNLHKLPKDGVLFYYYSQFTIYKQTNFDIFNPYIASYFFPTITVQKLAREISEKYDISPKDTYVVHYRRFDRNKTPGEDKAAETTPPSVSEFIDKFHQIYQKGKKIVLMTVDQEMQRCFQEAFPQTINIEEGYTPAQAYSRLLVSRLQRHLIRWYLQFINAKELEYLVAQVYLLSQSHTVFTTSGNLGLWLVLYRGHGNNVHQYLDNYHLVPKTQVIPDDAKLGGSWF